MNTEYFRIHSWLIYHHGKATRCENEKCESVTPKRFEWALLKGKHYKKNRNNYIQLCPSCHRKYDFKESTRKKISKARKGEPAKNKKAIILNGTLVFNSLTEASLKTGCGVTSISNNLLGLSKLTKVGKWDYQQKN